MTGSRKIGSVALLFVLLISFLLIPNLLIEKSGAVPQSGFFEGDVPIHGAYLQTINCDPRRASDDDGDGVLDAGFMGQYVEDPLIVDLEANGFYEGEKIMISHKQSVRSSSNQVWYFNLFGLFSSSRDLLTNNWEYRPSSGGEKWPMVGPEKRVPGAIDAALGGYVHPTTGVGDNTNTWKQGREVENDIPEDFQITGHHQFNEGKNGDPWTPATYAFNNWFWVTIPPGAKYLFFQVVSFWTISHDGYCRVTIDKDTDGDSIPDSWEIQGKIDFNNDDITDYYLNDALFDRKDIYVEVDYMVGQRFLDIARDDVVSAFENFDDISYGPIKIHIEIDDSSNIAKQETIRPWGDFDNIKEKNFGNQAEQNSPNSKWILTAKKYIFHYCLFAKEIELWDGTAYYTGTSGIAEPYGNDLIVSLGSFTGGVGSREEQAGTFMHELGHNLGLRHGGGDDVNYKPNYLSVMNYYFQMPSETSSLLNRPLTYSNFKHTTLNEEDLDEDYGIGVTDWPTTVYSVKHPSQNTFLPMVVSASDPIDWDNDGIERENGVKANLNHFPDWDNPSSDDEKLEGFDDLENLYFRFQEVPDFREGVHSSTFGAEELTWELFEKMEEAFQESESMTPFTSPTSSQKSDETNIDTSIIIVAGAIIVTILLLAAIVILRRKKRSEKLS